MIRLATLGRAPLRTGRGMGNALGVERGLTGER